MNNDLISRSALLEILELLAKFQPEYKQSTILGVCATIRAANTVDAEPVRHGRWIRQDDTFTRYICSECKSRNHADRANYCPNCGAKMDLEEDTNG